MEEKDALSAKLEQLKTTNSQTNSQLETALKEKNGLSAEVEKLKTANSQLEAALEETSMDLFLANEALGCNAP